MILKVWLKDWRMTISDFARKIGVSCSQVHKYVHEDAIPRRKKVMIAIFEATKGAVTANDFFGIVLSVVETRTEEKIQYEDYDHAKD